MSEKGKFRNDPRFEPEGAHALFENEKTLRVLLSASGSAVKTYAHSDNLYLLRCYTRAIDASSIDEAVFWHSEIVSELSVEIHTISRKPWSPQMRAKVIADLTERQDRHAIVVDRLMCITKPLTWRL
ncbi:hypothetical protein DLM45_03520 [Hyphomicrobium methylovorum]|uniref:hypothetical protein n=1 Tax=Hyphomicrobium methylovorum TaxID=84 RepID=UPI0015E7AA4E|nr:hypothetical protein [Hyphomicrobium methylovorum]MBA2125292.1 hypothetical protein [Hyphomicrobium methylovorum]